MPLYEYECQVCGKFERIRKFSDPPLEACPTCGGAIQKLISSPAFQFKGTGFYVTDYVRKNEGKSESEKSDSAQSKKESDQKAASSDSSKGGSKDKDSSASSSSSSSSSADSGSKAKDTPAPAKPSSS